MSVHLRQPLFDYDRALFGDDLDGVVVEDRSVACVQDDEARQAPNREVSRSWLHARVFEGQCEPGHLSEVFIVEVLVLVTRKEDHLHLIAALVGLVVELDQKGSELAARRAVVHREVKHQDLSLAFERLAHGRRSASACLIAAAEKNISRVPHQGQCIGYCCRGSGRLSLLTATQHVRDELHEKF